MSSRVRQTTLPLVGALLGLLLPGLASAAVEYYHLDGIGSVRAVTDAAGQVVERHDYLPYGEECLTGGCGGAGGGGHQPLRFTGKERDPETGLDYFGARYLDVRFARFHTVDPVQTWSANLADPQRWNRYAYARDNPYRYVDPDGRSVWTKAIKFVIKGGDVALTFQGVTEDAGTFFSMDHRVGTGPRLVALASLLSEAAPVSGRDIKEGLEFAGKKLRRRTVVIGENMDGRVIPEANKRGADYYHPPDAPPEQWMENNEKWINDVMDEGCIIVDCGPAPGRANFPDPTSPYYKMEREQIEKRGYPHYVPPPTPE
jgi:RHS repeat-associated protein